jgi:hypothetical protein
MNNYKSKQYIILLLFVIFTYGCKKQDEFLNAKPDVRLTVPNSLNDYQLLINQESYFTRNYPALGEVSADDYYVSYPQWVGAEPINKNAYIWEKDIYQSSPTSDWTSPYIIIYNANTILDGLNSIVPTSEQQVQYNAIKGSALFFRAFQHFCLMTEFTSPYDSLTASTQLGVPLKLSSDLNVKSYRSTQKECYDRIIDDLQQAISLLPSATVVATIPSQLSAKALLARIYLSLDSYSNAFHFADDVFRSYSILQDFNQLTYTDYYLTPYGGQLLQEDLFHSTMLGQNLIGFAGIVDSTLYSSYDSADLRKKYYFISYNGEIRFKGSYDFKSFSVLYNGLSNDELILIRAECKARAGQIGSAMDDLNLLLINRYETGKFTPRTAISPDDALSQILIERRKELCYRGLRWIDLRRLNKDPRFAVTLTRVLNGQTYILPPNDPKYALPIPDLEIKLTGEQQNPR